MNKLLKIVTTALLVFALSLSSVTATPHYAFAEESQAPEAPSAPAAATAPPAATEPPTAVATPQAPATPKPAATAKPATTLEPKPSSQATTAPQEAKTPRPAKTAQPSVADEADQTPIPSSNGTPAAGVSTGSQNGNSQTGSSAVTTGDANVNGSVINGVNSNITQGASNGTNNGADAAANSGNGTDSTNNATSNSASSSDQELANAANLSNDVHLGAVSGANSASRNTGDGEVVTGDANVGVTVINGANNNVSGLDVNQYDVNGNQSGDIILGSTAPTVSCGSNGTTCSNGVVGSTAKNTANGDSSNNNAVTNNSSESAAVMSNEADVVNDVVIDAVTGNNKADSNVGQGSVQTGDANVAVTVLNFLNNNIIAGTVDVVNIFGNYVGNIIIPESSSTGVAGNNAAGNNASGNHVSNAGNGDSSDNTATADSSNTNSTAQANLADIDNNLTVNTNTGENDTKSNTNGQNKIETGSTNVDANIYNVANVNSNDGGYIVLVNDNGVWRGTIYGGNANGSTAASEGVQFEVQPDGTVVASNQGNGTQSKNNAQANADSSTSTTQTNDAKVANNVTINADTGHNSASRNTGGGAIKTGNVNVGASIMNFVNNNFVGKTFRVVLVNVMGSWNGSVVAPGAKAPPAVGGANQVASQTQASATPAPKSASPSPIASPLAGPQLANNQSDSQPETAVLGKMITKNFSSKTGKQGAEIVLDNGQKFYVDDTLAVPEDKPIVASAVGVNTNASNTASSYWLYALALLPLVGGAAAIVIRKRKAAIEVKQ